ncbi:MAG TPA: NAD(P)-dependent oxidoreductase [Solirubrobacteraceae bacterium]|jgi:3-hydroxyisobutyrate dehydrogenase-like beta-hydroxyacid dehydrogenase|nr:NAD(P)-dependent oxidoreductase [Solirubrobacteraceae bacterium]
MRVAVLGLGRMGAPIAERLERAGHELAVWNRSPAATSAFVSRGATLLASPRAAWDHAELVITMLADDDAVKAVTLGEAGLLAADRVSTGTLVEMSTISATASAEIAAAAAAKQLGYLRAPVSGNPSVVTAGKLGIIVSGPTAEFERLAPTLREIGPNLFHVGDGEQARIVKLALNLMIGGTTQLLAEALVLAESHGLQRGRMLEVIAGSAIGSPYVNYKQGTLLSGDYSSTFTARLLHKDLGLALAAGHDCSVPLPVTAVVQQLVEGCIAQGMGDLDLAVLIPRLEREAGRENRTGPSIVT